MIMAIIITLTKMWLLCSYTWTIILGPGTDDKSSPPVNPDAFLTICNQYVVEATLSVGWTTTANGNKVRMPDYMACTFSSSLFILWANLILSISFHSDFISVLTRYGRNDVQYIGKKWLHQ